MSKAIELQPVTWERMMRAVEKVRERLLRATQALEQAGIPYAVVGGNAVAAWVSRVDESAVRNTADVDLLINRSDLSAVTMALEQAGFRYRHGAGIHMFLDGPNAKARDAVHVLFAGEKVRQEYVSTSPLVTESVTAQLANFKHIDLEALTRMKLNSFRDKDRMHLRDLISVGLLDQSWPARFEPPLAARLQELLDNPED
ncbi:MAG: nucleotidyltransferase family protein [Planctomycetia bacterium]|nr:nucleotidyltransferase family protein [Planctomycetia bacterium]